MSNFFWIGGRLWLDAVNSQWIESSRRVDGWDDPQGLGTWIRAASEHHEEAQSLCEFAGESDDLLLQMKQLRASLRLACETRAAGMTLGAVETLNAALRHRGAVLQVEASENGWRTREFLSGEATDALWIVARSAARSWASGDLERLKPCANPDCILWFLDTSKNGTRRWCSMQVCGNRNKVTAHYERRTQRLNQENS